MALCDARGAMLYDEEDGTDNVVYACCWVFIRGRVQVRVMMERNRNRKTMVMRLRTITSALSHERLLCPVIQQESGEDPTPQPTIMHVLVSSSCPICR